MGVDDPENRGPGPVTRDELADRAGDALAILMGLARGVGSEDKDARARCGAASEVLRAWTRVSTAKLVEPEKLTPAELDEAIGRLLKSAEFRAALERRGWVGQE